MLSAVSSSSPETTERPKGSRNVSPRPTNASGMDMNAAPTSPAKLHASSVSSASPSSGAFREAICPYNPLRVPTTASLAKSPVNMPTVAGQFSLSIPMGPKTGVMVFPRADNTDSGESSLPKEPSVPTEFNTPSRATTRIMTLPARTMNPRRRIHT